MVVMGWLVSRAGRDSSASGLLPERHLLGLRIAASLGPPALEDTAANAASRLKIGLVLVKGLDQMVVTSSGWVVASIIVLVLVEEQAGWSYHIV